MNRIKRLLFTLVVLGLNAPAFADNTLLEPDQKGGFKIGINGLYLRSTNSDLNFATKSPNIPTSMNEQQNLSAETNYDWGVYGQIGYLFPCTSNDLTLGYTYLRSTESIFSAAPSLSTSEPIDFVFFQQPTDITAAAATPFYFYGVGIYIVGDRSGTVKFNLNAIDLEGAHRFISGNYSMRMFSGLRYASVDYALTTFIYPNPNLSAPFLPPNEPFPTSDQTFTSQFSGIGPRIGADGRYYLGSGFGLNANISTALLIGHLDSDFKSNATANVINREFSPLVNSHFKAISDSQVRVVPVLEGKLGIDYVYAIDSDCNESTLMLEAGYQITHYFNAVDHTKIVSFSNPATGTSYSNSQISTSDVGFDGIYFGVKYYM